MSVEAPDALHLLAQDVAVLKRDYSGLHGDVTSIANKLDNLSAQVTAGQRANWPVIVSAGLGILGFAGMLIGGGWTVVDLRNENTVLKSIMPLAIQNSTSLKDRDDMRLQIADMADKIAGNGQGVGEINRDLREVETQFCALSDQLNYRLLSTHRLLDQLWRKAFGEPLANYEATPRIGRCSS